MRRAVMLAPEFGPNHGVLGEMLHHLGRLHSAEVSLRRAIELGCADDHAVWTVLGNNQRMLGHLDEALEMVTRALALAGGSAAAHSNVGVVLMQLGRFDESVAHFELAIAGEPENNGFHGYLGYALLAAGRLARPSNRGNGRSRADCAARSATSRSRNGRRPTPTRVSSCTGSRASATRSCSPRCIPISSPAREVVIECDTRLVPLFARSFPGRRSARADARRDATRDDARLRPRDRGGKPPALVPPDARRVSRAALVPRAGSGGSRRGASDSPRSGPGRTSASAGARRSRPRNGGSSTRASTSGAASSPSRASRGSICNTTTATASCATRRRASACGSNAGTGSTS